MPLVYDELSPLAAAQLAGEQPGQTLEATALVHEAYTTKRNNRRAGEAGWKRDEDLANRAGEGTSIRYNVCGGSLCQFTIGPARDDAVYHSFQLDWSCRLSDQLNHGVLPQALYAMTETLELRPLAEFCPLPEPEGPLVLCHWEENLPDATAQPPRTRFQFRDDRKQYACKVVTIRDDLHQPVAVVFWITRQDKETPYRLAALLRHAVGALTRDIHLLVVDLFPPSVRDPHGIHKKIWEQFKPEPFDLPPDKPLTLAAYAAGAEKVAYVENVAVGESLPDMPIFLTPEHYVPCPLEASYRMAWSVFPGALKGPLERGRNDGSDAAP